MEDDELNPDDEHIFEYDPELWDMTTTTNTIGKQTWYRIDPSKIETVQDIAMLLHAINIKFIDDHPDFPKIAHLLKKEDI